MNEFDYKDFLNGLNIQEGDLVEIASDLLSILLYCRNKKLKFDANKLIDELKQMVGNEGTIMIRTFSWDFCNKHFFDYNNTPSQTGSLGNYALKREDFKRTKHPIYSWSVCGKYKNDLLSLNNKEAFGWNTPFDFIEKHNGKLLVLGNITGTAITIGHHWEKLVNVPYRKEKIFEGVYIDENNKSSIRNYSMFVRPLNYSITSNDESFFITRKSWLKQKKCFGKIYDKYLSCYCYSYKLIKEAIFTDIVENSTEKFALFDGKSGGYDKCGIDWTTAKFD